MFRIPNDTRFVSRRAKQKLIICWETYACNSSIMALERGHIKLVRNHRRFEKRYCCVLGGCGEFGTTWTICQSHQTIPMQLVACENRTIVRNRHRDWLGEKVTTYFKRWRTLLLSNFLFLGCWVFEGCRSATIAWWLDLLVESHRHVCLLKFGW